MMDEIEPTTTGFTRYRLITGYEKFACKEMQYAPKFHHVSYYAKDVEVVKFMMALSSARKSGEVVSINSTDIQIKPLFGIN